MGPKKCCPFLFEPISCFFLVFFFNIRDSSDSHLLSSSRVQRAAIIFVEPQSKQAYHNLETREARLRRPQFVIFSACGRSAGEISIVHVPILWQRPILVFVFVVGDPATVVASLSAPPAAICTQGQFGELGAGWGPIGVGGGCHV